MRIQKRDPMGGWGGVGWGGVGGYGNKESVCGAKIRGGGGRDFHSPGWRQPVILVGGHGVKLECRVTRSDRASHEEEITNETAIPQGAKRTSHAANALRRGAGHEK